MKELKVRLEPDLWLRLKRQAKKEERSVSKQVTIWLRRALEEEKVS